jgi:eukaryotic-like serine/threonine-protein kinase
MPGHKRCKLPPSEHLFRSAYDSGLMAMPAELISHYKILGPLGSGGMGDVYKAEDTTLHRMVALKFLRQRSPDTPRVNESLRREAQTASALSHPNICTIYEVGEDAGEMFIAMEYIEGRTLAELIRKGPLPAEAVLRYARQVIAALAHAHDRGVIHGDLKPLNIIVTSVGEAKILDFGLARRNDPAEFDRQTLETMSTEEDKGPGGTFPYMAPEQIEGCDVTARTDIWAFGVMLYEMSTGERPFRGDNIYLLCNSILRDIPRQVSLEPFPGLTTIILRCLEKEPARRYQRASETRAALEALAPSAERTFVASKGAQSPRLRQFLILVLSALLIAAIMLLVIRSNNLAKFATRNPVPSQVLLAVLPPLKNGDASQAAFDSGLADTLNSRLGEISARHSLTVIPMNSTLEKGVTTLDGARQEFGANLVLVLNIQRARGDIRVNYALVDPRSHEQLRSGTITESASDPFALQDRVFENVAKALELQLAPNEEKSLTAHGTTEPAAYDFYIQGRGYLQDYVVPEKVESAIQLFRHALEKDPGYAAANAGLGEAYLRKYRLTHDSKWMDEAIVNCQKAVELNINLAAAHSCLGRAFRTTGDYEKAVQQYRMAIELEPSNDEAYAGLAGAYEHLGRPGDAEKLYKQAISARPAYWATYNWLGLFYMSQGRYEEAAAMYSQVVSLAPDSFTGYSNLGAIRILEGKYDDAIPLLKHSLSIRPTADALSNLGTAYFQMRRYAESATNFEEAVKLDQKSYVIWGNLGDAYYWTPGRRSEAANAYATAIALGEEELRLRTHDAQLLTYLASYHAMRGERTSALKNLKASLRLQPKDPDVLLTAAITYQQLGETSRCLDMLEQAVSLGARPETLLDTPNFDSLHDNPRFSSIIPGRQKN